MGVRITNAPDEYTKGGEQAFRREVENLLNDIASSLRHISSGSDTNGSLYSKRENFVTPPVGVVKY